MWNLKPDQWTFHIMLQQNPLVSPAFWMYLSFTCDYVTLCFVYLENIGSPTYTNLPKCWHISFYNIKASHSLISPLISPDVINYWEAIKLSATCRISKILIFLESSNFTFGTNTLGGSLESMDHMLKNSSLNASLKVMPAGSIRTTTWN